MGNEKLIFCGDLVCPFGCKVDYSQVKPLFENAIGIANLEGAILQTEDAVRHNKWRDKYSLYSSPAILDVVRDLNIRYVSLCNNHILDYEQPIEQTQQLLTEHGVRWWGLKNHDVLHATLNGKPLYLLTFATFANEHSLNLFNPHKVLQTIRELRRQEPDAQIVVYPHWGVEKFYYPEPADRELAHACVETGANLIVGHHPHVVQPVEVYKGVPIVYSLGNFILPQTYYGEKKLVYEQPEVLQELVVEWDGKHISLHLLHYDRENQTLSMNASQDTGRLYALFKKEVGYGRYLRIYLQHASWLDVFLRTRYVASLTNEYISYLLRNVLRMVRRTLITLGLHHPYMNGDKQKLTPGGGENRLLNIRRGDSDSLSAKVLFIGIDYHNPRGGIAVVEHVYSQWMHPFKFVATVVPGGKLKKLIILLRAIFLYLWKLLTDRDIEIVHVHGASNASFWRKSIFMLIGKKLFKKKIVYHIHGGGYKVFTQKHEKAVCYLLKQCTAIVTLSNSWKDFFIKELNCSNVQVINNPIPYPQKIENKTTVDKCTFLFLGLICKNKGVYDLIELLHEYHEEYQNKVDFLFGGNGEVENLVNLIEAYKINDIAHYIGWVSGDAKIKLWNIADVYILPSYYEGLPISILEAMSYALPIISTNVGGIPEILKNEVNGYLITPGDKNAMKEAIDRLITDKALRQRMGESSETMVDEHLPHYVANQLSNLYKSLL